MVTYCLLRFFPRPLPTLPPATSSAPPVWLVTSRRSPAPHADVTVLVGGVLGEGAHKELAGGGRIGSGTMKKVASSSLRPSCSVGERPHAGRWLLWTRLRRRAGGRPQGRGLPYSLIFPGPRGSGPRSPPSGRHHEVFKEGFPP